MIQFIAGCVVGAVVAFIAMGLLIAGDDEGR